jgi:hypothetical protein
LLESRTLVKPTLSEVKMPTLASPGGNPGVGKLSVGAEVGKAVAVFVGVNNSAPIEVTVGVKVSGVLVAVAKRFSVGIGVLLGNLVGVSTGGGCVAVAPSCGRSIFGKPEHPPSNAPNTRIWINFFIMKPL